MNLIGGCHKYFTLKVCLGIATKEEKKKGKKRGWYDWVKTFKLDIDTCNWNFCLLWTLFENKTYIFVVNDSYHAIINRQHKIVVNLR